jgi:glycine cleavage system aminomethyltransferase T
MSWAIKLDKPSFVGKSALRRMSAHEPERQLVALRFDGAAPAEGAALSVGGQYVGYLTSSRYSPTLEHGVALGWTSRVNGEFPSRFDAEGLTGEATDHSFYDPDGERLRA